MTTTDPDIHFDTDISEAELVAAIRTGILRTSIDRATKFVTNRTYKAFDMLYGKIGSAAPTWNSTTVETIELLHSELEERQFVEIGKENKDFFLTHLFANSQELFDRAKQHCHDATQDPRKEILEHLIEGLTPNNNADKMRSELGMYFNRFPRSDHFLANLVFAGALLECGLKAESKHHAMRAFQSVPYDQRGSELLLRIDPNDSVVQSIRSIMGWIK